MSSPTNSETKTSANESNLDFILDDALEDFNKPIPPQKNEETSSVSSAVSGNTNAWTDEFIAAATQNFETTMRSILNQQKDATVGEASDEASSSIDLGSMSAEFAKFAEAAAKAATESSTDKDFTQCLADTMQQMAKNKEETQTVPSAEELGKMFENFGLGDAGSGDGSELGGLFPLMQTMLENILSKDILYPPLKEIVTKYPDWLADNRSNLSEEDFDQYNKQYDIMKQVVEKFEKETDEDSEEVKAQTSESILLLMQKLQELGQPPQDLIGDYEPLINLDDKGNPQLPDLSTLLGGAGFPSFGSFDPSAATNQPSGSQGNLPPSEDGNEQCTVM